MKAHSEFTKASPNPPIEYERLTAKGVTIPNIMGLLRASLGSLLLPSRTDIRGILRLALRECSAIPEIDYVELSAEEGKFTSDNSGFAYAPSPEYPIARILLKIADEESMKNPPSSLKKMNREILARKFDFSPDQFTSELERIYTVLHELGHIKDFYEKLPIPHTQEQVIAEGESRRAFRREQMQRLPLPGFAPSRIMHMSPAELEAHIEKLGVRASLQERGIDEKLSLVRAQLEAYRDSPDEKSADTFAINFMKKYRYIS